MCPRYNKVLLYEVTEQEHLKPAGEIALQGRPVAMAALSNNLVVLRAARGRRQAPYAGLVGGLPFRRHPVL